jgi:hypothetical protein
MLSALIYAAANKSLQRTFDPPLFTNCGHSWRRKKLFYHKLAVAYFNHKAAKADNLSVIRDNKCSKAVELTFSSVALTNSGGNHIGN